jgi:cytochrome c oxidase accessory protein FixG
MAILSGKPPDKLTLPTLDGSGKRRWVYPILTKGRYFWARLVVAVVLTVAYLGIPHLRIAGKPAFQIDLATRQLYLFGATFFATDTKFLAAFGVTFVLSILLVTALLGRIWCGWSCPQTIYMEFVFRPIEALFEGPPHWRRRAAGEPITAKRFARKAGKWAVYLVLASVLAHTFVTYFTGTDALFAALRGDPRENWSAFVTVAIVTGMVFVDFAWFREQTCFIACPYGRLQSALIDENSMIVGYDLRRGEPRRKSIDRKEGDDSGDCVACRACVRTCPTNIDIREGLQLECVGCTQCIDACDTIMDRVKKPRGLIRYTSLNQLEGKPARIFRPRILLYAVVMLAALTVLVTLLVSRTAFEFDVVRQTGSPFYIQSDGLVVNRIRVRITNRLESAQQFDIEVVEPKGADLVAKQMPVEVASHKVVPVDGLVRVPRSAFISPQVAAVVRVTPVGGQSEEAKFVLLGPVGGGS